MNTHQIIKEEKSAFFQTYKRLPIVPERAIGNKIWDKAGDCYYDFLSGIAVNALGHSHCRIVEAATEQLKKFMHISNYFYQEPQIKFATKLKSMANLDRIFLCNSGTEATEGAIKLCRSWGYDKNKTEIIAFSGGFHGRTYGALSLMDKPNYKEKMGPWLDNMKTVEYNNCEVLKESVSERTAGIVFECIQGEGGLDAISQESLTIIHDLKAKFDFLIIVDEIQTGAGRTGKFLACESFNIKPDIVTMAKAIGGGLPLGAILATEKLANVWTAGNHGSTYGGNPVACATGLVVLEELERGVMQNALNVGRYFKQLLTNIHDIFPDKIIEIRGIGLMLGVVLTFEASKLVEMLLEEKIISNATSGNVLRIVPPLIIENSDADIFINKLTICLEKL